MTAYERHKQIEALDSVGGLVVCLYFLGFFVLAVVNRHGTRPGLIRWWERLGSLLFLGGCYYVWWRTFPAWKGIYYP